jgi:hypothetical protein
MVGRRAWRISWSWYPGSSDGVEYTDSGAPNGRFLYFASSQIICSDWLGCRFGSCWLLKRAVFIQRAWPQYSARRRVHRFYSVRFDTVEGSRTLGGSTIRRQFVRFTLVGFTCSWFITCTVVISSSFVHCDVFGRFCTVTASFLVFACPFQCDCVDGACGLGTGPLLSLVSERPNSLHGTKNCA